MCLALTWTRFGHKKALLETIAGASLVLNLVSTALYKDDRWQNVQPALATLPLLLALDINYKP
jgi:hypothetical protein